MASAPPVPPSRTSSPLLRHSPEGKLMVVWILLEYDGHEGSVVRGAFSSYALAVAEAKHKALAKYNSAMWDIHYDIWDEEVDCPWSSPYA